MAGWETQGFERGWGGTGRTFLSHYKRPSSLGNIRRGRPLAPWGRRCGPRSPADGEPRQIPDHHHSRGPRRCPGGGSLSPRCSGWKPPGGCVHQALLITAHVEEEGKGRCCAAPRGVRAPMPSLFPGKQGRGAGVLRFHPKQGFNGPFSSFLRGTEGWERLQGRSPHPCSSSLCPCLFCVPLFNWVVCSSPNFSSVVNSRVCRYMEVTKLPPHPASPC